MSGYALLLWAVATPLLAALAAPWLGRVLGARAGYPLALAFAPGLALVTLAPNARQGAPAEASLAWVPSIGLAFDLRADGFSLVFALLVAGIGLLIMLYAAAYLGAHERHGRFYSYLLLFGGAMLGLVLVDNLIALYLFWEATSLSSFLLIGFWDARKAAQDGALKALLVTVLGGLALLVAVVLTGLGAGTLRLSQIDAETLRQSGLFTPALLGYLLAAFTKSSQLPFHLWLPTAMEAPTPVSAFLHSATMVKAGVMLTAKLSFLLPGTALAPLVVYLGLATMVWGAYLALRQNDLKALLAFSTVSQLGLLMALYGAGYAFAATAHLVNQAAFKAALFMVVGIVDHEARSRDLRELSGLGRTLPVTAYLLALPAALSMAGLPPLGGFISKELFYQGMLESGAWPALLAVGGSVLTFAYSFKFLRVFFGPYRSAAPETREAAPRFWLPVAPLALATVAFGVLPRSGGAFWASDTVVAFFTDLAQPSFGYDAEGLYLWHGLGVVLALSVLTWFAGAALFVSRDAFLALQERLTPRWNANTVYYALLAGLERFADRFIRATQGTGFTTQLRLVLLGVGAVGAAALWRYLPSRLAPVPLEFLAVVLAVVAGVVGVLGATSRLSAIIFTGLVGLGSTVAFVLLSAPDLALTQLLIEVVTVILFLSVFRFLPELRRYARPRGVAVLDALLALFAAATTFTVLLAVQTPVAERIGGYFLRNSKVLAGGDNVVNVILVDFRGYDTMGEITVLAVVAVAVLALLRLAAERRQREEREEEVAP